MRKISCLILVYLCLQAGLLTASPNESIILKKNLFYKLRTPSLKSVLFTRIKDNAMLYSLDADRLLSPASVTKLLTSSAALHYFGPTHQFQNRFYYTGSRDVTGINGNLIAVGSGDPYITNEHLWQFAADIRHMGIRQIRGDIVIDNTLFDQVNYDESRTSSKLYSRNAYDAPISAWGVNFNTYPIVIAPGDRVGQKANVTIDPYLIQGVEIINNVSTIHHGLKGRVSVRRVSNGSQYPKLILDGNIAIGSPLEKVYRSAPSPLLTSGETIRVFLQRAGIQVMGQVKAGKLPSNSTELHMFKGHQLGYIIEGLNKYSNNYIADVLVKCLGAYHYQESTPPTKPGSLDAGIQVIRSFLRNQVGIHGQFTLQNGSGLDLDNRVSASQIVELLKYMFNQIEIFPEFIASLPNAGLEGTMEKRFTNGRQKDLIGKVRAKTGTLTQPISVAGLSGYLHHPNHGYIAFAILENGERGKAQPSVLDLRDRQDDVVWRILDYLNHK